MGLGDLSIDFLLFYQGINSKKPYINLQRFDLSLFIQGLILVRGRVSTSKVAG
jgi:hypothetical protein